MESNFDKAKVGLLALHSMPTSKSSLISLTQFSKKNIELLFNESLLVKNNFNKKLETLKPTSNQKKTAALLFFEPSTRTRFSFEAACVRAGYHPMVLDAIQGTSLEKGESVLDTVLNIEAMRPDFFIIRASGSVELNKIEEQLGVPVINAGWGSVGHPTQALLDTLSLYEKWQTLENKKILFVGDIKHSRVVASHIELAKILNYEVGFCAPKDLLPDLPQDSQQKYFATLNDGLSWADAVMALRVQKERHGSHTFDLDSYQKNYGLNLNSIKNLRTEAWIMHPGPINYGVELEQNILTDKRSLILKQVENGVFLRETIIRKIEKIGRAHV